MRVLDIPFGGLDQSDEDIAFLQRLADARGYAVHKSGTHRWLEWDDESTPAPADPQVAEAFTWFTPFEPFVYPEPDGVSGRADLNVRWPTFLSHQPRLPGMRATVGQGVMAMHVRLLAARLDRDCDGRAEPDRLGWLVVYRDALARDLQRCAERLTGHPDGLRSSPSPLGGALAVLKSWLAEAAVQSELWPRNGPRPLAVAMITWEHVKGGVAWGGDDRLAPAKLQEWFAGGGSDALADATVAGLHHYVRARDVVTAPAFDLWPRLLAAETVLHAALRGTPLDDAWVEEAVRQQQEDEARRAREAADAEMQDAAKAELRRTLLDPETRLPYIVNTLYPQASQNPKTRSVWRDTWVLFVAAWASVDLPEETRPHSDFEALRKAAAEARRRERVARGRQMG